MNILIKNAMIVSAAKIKKADILIEEGVIARIDENITESRAQVVNAEGKYIFPGFIDAHTHMGIPIRGTTSADDFESGSLAALHGGVTTIIDFTVQEKGESLFESVKKRKTAAEAKSSVDYALHCNVTDLDEKRLAEIPDVVKTGIISFKAFTAYKDAGMQLNDRQILDLFWKVKQTGGTVMFHAENGDLIDFLTEKYIRYNKKSPAYHAASRPAQAEVEAVSRIITLNNFIQCPIYFVHLTTAEAVQLVGMAKQAKQPVYAETCPQYLLFDRSVYEKEGGHRYIAAPPFRTPKDQEYLWIALNEGLIDVVGTDHCPFSKEQKEMGERKFHLTPNGLPGVETLFPLLYSEGVKKSRLTLERLVSLIAEEPARLFGLFPQKGILMKDSDADLVIFNPAGQGVISAENLHSNTDWSPYEGRKVDGKLEAVMLRGQWLIKDGKLQEDNLRQGRFIRALI